MAAVIESDRLGNQPKGQRPFRNKLRKSADVAFALTLSRTVPSNEEIIKKAIRARLVW